MNNRVINVLIWIKSKLFSARAFIFLTIILIALLYMILIKQQFSVKIVVAFCILFCLWLSNIISYFDSVVNTPQEIKDLIQKSKSQSRDARKYIYDFYRIPFYIIMGESGAGKTTLVQSSGLEKYRNLDDEEQGKGGTRGCDFFLRKEMILLDTAGLITQNKDLWVKFLERVSEVRPLYPINGVLVVIPIDTLCSIPSQKSPFNPYTDGIHSDVKSIVSNKANDLKRRLTELKQNLNFKIPVYVIISKCDLLEGFGNPTEKINASKRGFCEILQETERGKIVGMPMNDSFEKEFDNCIEQIRTWYLMKAIQPAQGTNDIAYYNGSRFIENLSSIKESLSVYHETLHNTCDIRGYFFSSCIPFLIGHRSEWRQSSLAYFVYDLFYSKILKEKGLGRPDIEAVGARTVWKNRLKVCALGIVMFLIFLSGIYFYQNFTIFKNLTDSTKILTTELPEAIRLLPAIPYKHQPEDRKKIENFHNDILNKTLQIHEDFKDVNTKSAFLIGSYHPLEKDFKELSIQLFYDQLVYPTFHQLLYNWKEKELSSIQNLHELIRCIKALDEEYKIYLEATKTLDGFDKLYSMVFPDCSLGRNWPKVKAISKASKFKPNISFDDKESIQKLRDKLSLKMISLCSSENYMNQGYELLICYKELAQISSSFITQENTKNFINLKRFFDKETKIRMEEWKKRIIKWQDFVHKNLIKIKNPKASSELLKYQQDYEFIHNLLLQEDLNHNESLISELERSTFLTMQEAQESHKKYSEKIKIKLLGDLNNYKIMLPNGLSRPIPTLYDELNYKIFQIDTIPRLIEITEKKNLGESDVTIAVNLLKTISDTSVPSTSYLDYAGFKKAWESCLTDCFESALYFIQGSYMKEIEETNAWFFQSRLKEKYIQKLQSALENAKISVENMAKLKENLNSEINIERFLTHGDISEIVSFIKSDTFDRLIEISAQRINDKNLDETEYEILLASLPSIYNSEPKIEDHKTLVSWTKVYLFYKLTQRFSSIEDKLIEYWEKRLKELLNNLSQDEDWKIFSTTCHQGRLLYDKLREKSFFQAKYHNIINDIYSKMVRLYDLELTKEPFSGAWLLKGSFAFQEGSKFWREANSQLSKYIDLFHPNANRFPESVLGKKEFIKIKNLCKRFPKGTIIEFPELYQPLINVIIPWIQLKSDSRIDKIMEVSESSINADWIGKKILDLYENEQAGYVQFSKNPMPTQEFSRQVIILWKQSMDSDFKQWQEKSRNALAQILENMEKEIQDKFPFAVDSTTEIALSKVDSFYKTFSLIQKHFKVYMMKSHHDLPALREFFSKWENFFHKYETWQKALYGESSDSLEKIFYEVKFVLPKNMPYYISRVSLCDTYWDCGNIFKRNQNTWIQQKEFSFQWKWGMNIELIIEAPLELQIKFQSIVGKTKGNKIYFEPPQYTLWGLWGFLHKYKANVSEESAELSFPHQIKSEHKTSLNIGIEIFPSGKPGKYPFPWK